MTNAVIDPNLIKISGPVNIARLEGDVHGIKKVIYLFMDYHMEVNNQTQCTNIFSEDVQKYFVNSFYNLNKGDKIYDFFLEIYPTELGGKKQKINYPVDSKEKYIEEVVKFFRKLFVYDPKKNKVSINKLFKNVRLHYIDIRDYYKTNIFDRISQMKYIANNFMCENTIDINKLDRITNLLEIMRNHLELIISVLSDKTPKKPTNVKVIRPVNYNIDMDALNYLANKVREAYKYDDIKKKMNKILDENIENFSSTVNDVDDAIDQFNKYADELQETDNRLVKDENTIYEFSYGLSPYTIRNMIVDIANRVEELVDDKFVEYFARFIDIYFLRRFLDKDYITNAITYTGALHSNTYMYILVTEFDFKVTHISYSKIKDIDKLNKEIKKRGLMEVQELILPPTLQQCSDMTNFPKNFE